MNPFSKSAIVARRAVLTIPGQSEPATPPVTAPPVSGDPPQNGQTERPAALPSTPREVLGELRQQKRISNEALEERITGRLDRVHAYLTPAVLEAKLGKANLKEIGVYEGILLTHLQHLRSRTQPGPAWSSRTLDEMMPAVLLEIKRRGLTGKLTERTAEITVQPTAMIEK